MRRLALSALVAGAVAVSGCVPTAGDSSYPGEANAYYNPEQFPDKAGQRITSHPSFKQITESKRRINYQRMHGDLDYAQRPGFYRSMQEHIDAETGTADPYSAYDRAEVSKIRARLEEAYFWKRVQQKTGRKPNVKQSSKYYP